MRTLAEIERPRRRSRGGSPPNARCGRAEAAGRAAGPLLQEGRTGQRDWGQTSLSRGLTPNPSALSPPPPMSLVDSASLPTTPARV